MKANQAPDIRDDYDFSKGVRRKYAAGTNVVVLDADVAKVFANSKSVNDALRALAQVAQKHASDG